MHKTISKFILSYDQKPRKTHNRNIKALLIKILDTKLYSDLLFKAYREVLKIKNQIHHERHLLTLKCHCNRTLTI